jgi:hypothetical protein
MISRASNIKGMNPLRLGSAAGGNRRNEKRGE